MTDDRPKRPPPTIDMEPNVSSGGSAWQRWLQNWRARFNRRSFSFAPRWPDGLRLRLPLLAAASGALAALVVVAALWFAGLMTQPAVAPASTATDELSARLTRIEARASPPQGPDPALTARIAGVEQSLESLRQSSQQMQQALQRQAEAVTSSLNEIKSTPRPAAPAPTPAVDLAPLNQRIGELEQSIRGLTAAQRTEPEPLDPAIARLMVANQLDAAVRNGQPFAPALAAAKQSGSTVALTPLEPFAATGLPDDATLARELIALLPQLEPKAAAQPAPTGLIERLEASAARLVRVRPVGDGAGDDPASLVQRIGTAVRRNDVTAARRGLDALAPVQRTPADAWIARYDAREAARKASLAFATEALVALPKR